VFSMVHHWVFSYRQFAAPHVASASAAPESVTLESSDFTRAMKAMVDLDDVWTVCVWVCVWVWV